MEYVGIPKAKHNWLDILSSIPKDMAAKVEFTSRMEAQMAGERARYCARSKGLGKLHTSLVGGQWQGEKVAYLMLWF